MTYLQDKKNKKDKTLKVVFIFFMAGLLFLGFRNGVDSLSYFSLKIFGKTSDAGSNTVNSFLSSFVTKKSLEQRIFELEAEINKYREKEIYFSVQQQKISELSDMLNYSQRDLKKEVLDRVSPLSIYGTFILNRNLNSNIKEGDIVLDKRGLYIGRVGLLSDSNVTVLVSDYSKEEIKTNILGTDIESGFEKFSNGVLYSKVPNNLDINVGQDVVLAENRNIKIRTISEITKNEKESYKKVFIRSGRNINSEKIFSVIIN